MYYMTNPEVLHTPVTPEVDATQGVAVFETISAIDSERNPDFTAFEQIQGTALAKLYLQGRAADMATRFADDFAKDPSKTPLETTIANMRYLAGYYVSGDNAGQQISDMLRCWNQAFNELTQTTE